METFAKRLEKLRSLKNMSRTELSAALNLPRNAVEKMETGRLTPPKEQQAGIAAYFGVSLAYLRGESDDADGGSWLSGNLPKEEETAPAPKPPVRRIVAQSESDSRENSAMFRLLLESEAFQQAVLEVLRSPEGQKLMANAARKELRGY